MMDDPNPQNDASRPSGSPFGMTPVKPYAADAVPQARQRPGGLTAICVLAIVLGATGLLGGCMTITSQLFTTQMQKAVAGLQPEGNQGMAEMQGEMNARMLAVSRKYTPIVVPLSIVKLAVEGALVVGGIMSFGFKPRGRKLLLGALVAAIVIELILLFPNLLMQHETQAVMSEMFPKVMQEAQQGPNQPPPGLNNLMSAIFSVAGIIGIIFMVAWLAIKSVYYVIGIVYLRKPSVAQLFTPPAIEPTEWR